MTRSILIAAALTGLFCAAFAMGIDWLTDMLQRGQVFGISFLSGFLGSLFASFVLGRRRHQRHGSANRA
ncbi:MAG: hypothetical protein AAFN59_08865 [Pseudomonadota bacterium]